MKDLIFLMDEPEERFCTSLKMGNSILNRFTIDEDARFEVLGIHYLAKLGSKIKNKDQVKNNRILESDLLQKGTEMWNTSCWVYILLIRVFGPEAVSQISKSLNSFHKKPEMI